VQRDGERPGRVGQELLGERHQLHTVLLVSLGKPRSTCPSSLALPSAPDFTYFISVTHLT
jgi:hypothetical protein